MWCGDAGIRVTIEYAMTQLPLACTLGPTTISTRKAELLPGLLEKAETIQEIPEGYRLRFAASSDTLQKIASVIDAERQCCRFLQFELTIEPGEGPMWLTLSGPAGTREFLAALIES
jgi:hypothetical protein